MANIFNSVKFTKPGRSVFDLSHDVKLSCNLGELIPTLVMECVPGDSFTIGCDSLLRFAPLVAPVMHRMDVTMHYFFCPNRLVWPGWENFITNTPYEGETTLPAFPTLEVDDVNYMNLMDYMGIPRPPIASPSTELISAIPFAAFQKIYNEYYRDQNLSVKVVDTCIDGDNAISMGDLGDMRMRSWEHDYFTSALPFAQKGAPVSIPLGDVQLKTAWADVMTPNPEFVNPDGTEAPAGDLVQVTSGISTGGAFDTAYDPKGTLETASTTINDLRRAFRLQEWLEKAARGGSRYIENIRAMFGVNSSDKRLNRPEYITGTKSPVIISEVLSSAETTAAPQANMAGHAVSVTQGKYGKYFCEEHGYIIGIMSVIPKTSYFQGIPKHFTKHTDPFQYFQPPFANIGEQPIENRELFAYQITGADTFGYTPRYAEYKFMQNRVAGDFRDNLDHWHMAREFDSLPNLNQSFIESNPTARIFAVTTPDVHKLYANILHKIKAVRPMPKFGTPTF